MKRNVYKGPGIIAIIVRYLIHIDIDSRMVGLWFQIEYVLFE